MNKLLLLAADKIELQPKTGEFVGLGGLELPQIIAGLIKLTLVIAAIVFFFILVIGGIQWIASGGDKAQTEAARNRITAALVGLVIVFAAWAIIALINTFFGINIFSLTLPTV